MNFRQQAVTTPARPVGRDWRVLLVLVLGLLLSRELMAADRGEKPFNLEGPQVLLPPLVRATKKAGPDFYLFYFIVGEDRSSSPQKTRQVLFAYVGFAPSFPRDSPESVRETPGQINGKPTRTLTWKDSKGKLRREVLWKTGRSDFVRQVHFIYSGLTEADAKLADSIIATVRSSSSLPPSRKGKQHK